MNRKIIQTAALLAAVAMAGACNSAALSPAPNAAGEKQDGESAVLSPAAAEAALEIVESPIAEDCYTKVEGTREIDTVVVHYTSAIYWFDAGLQRLLKDEDHAYARSIGLTPATVHDHKYDWKLNKAIFQAYKVSSHYIIDREGTVVQFVPDNHRAHHAGQSRMPTDGREAVNGFSIGIELTSSHPKDDPTVKTAADAYTEAQYTALNHLISRLCKDHKITAVVGHDEIAPDRKTDPGPLFQWSRVRTPDYRPIACP